jgi:hypothetical protein
VGEGILLYVGGEGKRFRCVGERGYRYMGEEMILCVGDVEGRSLDVWEGRYTYAGELFLYIGEVYRKDGLGGPVVWINKYLWSLSLCDLYFT